MHRLWLNSLVNIDPDVMFFRSRHNALKGNERQLLQDLGTITGFKATSDLPQWMNRQEVQSLRNFLESDLEVKKTSRYKYQVDSREVDFSAAMPMHPHRNVPVWLAQNLGFLKIAKHQVLPAILESLKHNHEMNWLFYPLSTSL